MTLPALYLPLLPRPRGLLVMTEEEQRQRERPWNWGTLGKVAHAWLMHRELVRSLDEMTRAYGWRRG